MRGRPGRHDLAGPVLFCTGDGSASKGGAAVDERAAGCGAQGSGDPGESAERSVVIAMLTYRRLDQLGEAIRAVLAQTDAVQPTAVLMVVDNDPAANAKDVVADFTGRGVQYLHEPTPGIAAARNRALQAAPDDAWLVFIDDDERPHPEWLTRLVAAQRRYGGAAMVGPVVSEYETDPDPWIVAGKFFTRRRLPTGTALTAAATNNILLDLTVVNRLGLRFDEAFGQSGGSDTLFTRRLARAGHRMLWCDEAIVADIVPNSRLTRRWVLARAFRSGNSWTRTSLALATGPWERCRVRIQLAATGSIRIGGGALRVLLGLITRRTALLAGGHKTLRRGAGMVAGITGYTYSEYRRAIPN
jgi:succinoglycan biosynthesis protein ExoM